MITDYIKLNELGEKYSEVYDSTRSGLPTAVFGVTQGEKYLIASKLDAPILYIAKDSVYANKACMEIEVLSGKKTVYLPAKDDVLLYRKAYNKDSLYKRITALYEISSADVNVVTTPEALMQFFPSEIKSLKLSVGKEYTLEYLTEALTQMGYSRVDNIENKAEFSVRGDILEIFPINSDYIYKCDFFGDELESVKTKDYTTGEIESKVDEFVVVMAYDFYFYDGERKEVVEKLKKSLKKMPTLMARQKAEYLVDDLIWKLEGGGFADSFTFLMPILQCATGDFFRFISQAAIVIFDESKMIKETSDGIIKEHSERFKKLFSAGEVLDFSIEQYRDFAEVVDILCEQRLLAVQNITSSVGFFNPLKTLRVGGVPLQRYTAKQENLINDLKNWKYSEYRAIVCCGTDRRAEVLCDTLEKSGVYCELSDKFNKDFTGVKITSFYLGNGFICHQAKLVVVGTGDLYLQSKPIKKIKKKRNDLFQAPEVGDFAVHETFGIGRVLGTQRISTQESTKDYVEVEYRDGDRLYIPVEEMDKLTKYLGGEQSPQLSKIGGMEFERIKQRVREAISKMTINLKKLYAERKKSVGFTFSPDNELSQEFDDSFEFEPTEDQIQSIKEIKSDMESSKVMDRLLCGDVGYGKTEVALRAAFKAVLDGKQVAMVAPTTILSEQHYNTCKKRFAGFGVRVDSLNRFKTPLQQAKVIEKLKNGEIDVVVGTHSLFSNKIQFKDLGLLVLDEEQRFGVEHKEKLKTLKNNVDTLTMTATPIPRTLHLSLSGIRDISTINTPPSRRIPVQTYVVEESKTLIADAVGKELARDGQVFILYNRVDGIYNFASEMRELLPEAKISVAHGQLPERELENSINEFFEGRSNVLIATTIIENGIDLPNANTLIVIDADRLGLSTLYQLKGRVGRSDRMAHAYFTFSPNKVLTEDAYKRLNAIMEFSEMGSGYKIAMRDLEIRGAGNVLGKEQHGHMDKIGYELYSKLLKEQLGETTKNYQMELDIRISAYIPEGYIENSASRMDCYKQIAEIKTQEDKDRVEKSIVENFGEMPLEVENLIKIALLKEAASKYGIIKLYVSKKTAEVHFKDINSLNDEDLNAALNEYKDVCKLTFGATPIVVFTNCVEDGEERLETLIEFLRFSASSLK